ncbi:hypothetical protein [Nonomuraea sp. KM90]|uniref:hypothetical protein n=1 Tax=Nonomuraea sp. KM90 TaxID=3457428 RepID=UPI003FCE5C9B
MATGWHETVVEHLMGRLERAARVLCVEPRSPQNLVGPLSRLAGWPIPGHGPARELIKTITSRLDEAEPGVLITPHDLRTAAERHPALDGRSRPMPQSLLDAIAAIDVRISRLSPPILRQAAVDLQVTRGEVDTAIREAFQAGRRRPANTTSRSQLRRLDEPEQAGEDEHSFAHRVWGALPDPDLDDVAAQGVLHRAVRARVATLGDLFLRITEGPVVPVAWWCPPDGYHREARKDTDPLIALAWCRVPGAPQPLHARVTPHRVSPAELRRLAPFCTASPHAREHQPMYWEVGWTAGGVFQQYCGATEPTLAAAQFAAAEAITDLRTRPRELRLPASGGLLDPRTKNSRPHAQPRIFDLNDILRAVRDQHRAERTHHAGGRPPLLWPVLPHTSAAGMSNSIVAHLLHRSDVPLPDPDAPANTAPPTDEAFISYLTSHAVVVTPLALAYLEGMGDAGPDPRPLAEHHAAGMLKVLASRTHDGLDLLARETPALPAQVPDHVLLDLDWLHQWLPLSDDIDSRGRSR